MANIDLSWTNNSVGLNAEGTRVERVTNGNFITGSIEVIATGNTGGLDPEAASGSYTDNTVEAGKSYTYRIVTFGGTQNAASFSIGPEIIPDVQAELGYPGGFPETAVAYNIGTTPVVHFDFKRVSGIDVPSLAYEVDKGTADGGHMTNYFEHGQTRVSPPYLHDPTAQAGVSIRPVAQGSSKTAQFYSPANTHPVGGYQVKFDTPLELPDEATVFYAFHCSRENVQAHCRYGYNGTVNGVNYVYSYNGTINGVANVPTPWINTLGPHIVACRILNTPAAVAGGGAKFQLIYNGTVLSTKSFLSHHTDPANGYGASYMPKFITPYHYWRNSIHTLEAMLFDKALDYQEMNSVFAYLGDQLDIPVAGFNPSDIYDG